MFRKIINNSILKIKVKITNNKYGINFGGCSAIMSGTSLWNWTCLEIFNHKTISTKLSEFARISYTIYRIGNVMCIVLQSLSCHDPHHGLSLPWRGAKPRSYKQVPSHLLFFHERIKKTTSIIHIVARVYSMVLHIIDKSHFLVFHIVSKGHHIVLIHDIVSRLISQTIDNCYYSYCQKYRFYTPLI